MRILSNRGKSFRFFFRDDVDRKLKAAEQREESHIKRITEKDKAITKMR